MAGGFDWMRFWRIFLAVAGIALLIFGASRLLTKVPGTMLVWVAIWLVAALIIHDGIVSPLVLMIGVALRRFVPDRGRRYLQAGLIVAAVVTVIALPLMYRRDSQPPSKALLLQNYPLNWALLLGLIGAGVLILYAIRVARAKPR